MKEFLLFTLATSSVDSLNPIGITQQFILQGMVKKPRHIWYFILTTGVVNMIFGYLVYYGAMAFINSRLDYVREKFGLALYAVELLLGLAVLIFSLRFIIKKLMHKKRRTEEDARQNEEKRIKAKIKSVTPLALITVGVISTASELTSAVPYFAFLAVLVNHQFSFLILTAVMVFYNIIYMLPFMILYLVYIISKRAFDKIYDFFKNRFRSILEIALPVLFLLIGAFVMADAAFNLHTFLHQ